MKKNKILMALLAITACKDGYASGSLVRQSRKVAASPAVQSSAWGALSSYLPSYFGGSAATGASQPVIPSGQSLYHSDVPLYLDQQGNYNGLSQNSSFAQRLAGQYNSSNSMPTLSADLQESLHHAGRAGLDNDSVDLDNDSVEEFRPVSFGGSSSSVPSGNRGLLASMIFGKQINRLNQLNRSYSSTSFRNGITNEPNKKDYEALGVTVTTPKAKVREQFLKLMQEKHPDKRTGETPENLQAANEEIARLRNSYESIIAFLDKSAGQGTEKGLVVNGQEKTQSSVVQADINPEGLRKFVKAGDYDAVKEIVNSGVKCDRALLETAFQYSSGDIARFLIKKNRDLIEGDHVKGGLRSDVGKNGDYMTLMDVAIKLDRPDVVTYLYKEGNRLDNVALYDSKTFNYLSPVQRAIYCGSTKALKTLLSLAAEKNISLELNLPSRGYVSGGSSKWGGRDVVMYQAPAFEAAKKKYWDGVKLLVEIGKLDLNFQETSSGDTILHRAAKQDNAEMVTYLINRGADPTIQNKDGKTAYDCAYDEDHEALCEKFDELIAEKNRFLLESSTPDSLLLKGSTPEEEGVDQLTDMEKELS